ncbi:M28 family peptidase [Streptomyces sp. NPDC006784]|uniref:M28 family peptidase n=1 Tax=Streptomyces sp. NPDC006784 TaxID=3364764 RepID=UPI0036917563
MPVFDRPLRHTLRLAAAAALSLACLSAQQAGAAPLPSSAPAGTAATDRADGADGATLSPEQLAERVRGRDVTRHLRAFQRIADASGGNRGYNRPGFTRSVRYVAGKLAAAGYQVERQRVPYTDFAIAKERLSVRTGSGAGRHVPVLMTRFTPSTSAAGLDARVVAPPRGKTGCAVSDYDGVAARGAVVVLARDACGFGHQQQVAAQVGARAVVMYYPTPSPRNNYRLIGLPRGSFVLPMGMVSQADGERLARQAASRAGARVHLTLRGHDVRRTTVNLIAETRGGDPDDVVVMGGHLDSVPEAPGVDDNGSTAATVLQTALELAPHQDRVRNKVRFMWWGAEELIDVGSGYYVDHLSPAERGRIAAVLNAELLAPSNYGRFVWDPGTGGSHRIAELFAGYFERHGLPYERQDPGAIGSDHLVFQAAGIPVGGLDGGNLQVKTPEQQARFGGTAGQMFDPCYHQPCDRLEAIDRTALDTNAHALAWVLGELALKDGAVRGIRAAG